MVSYKKEYEKLKKEYDDLNHKHEVLKKDRCNLDLKSKEKIARYEYERIELARSLNMLDITPGDFVYAVYDGFADKERSCLGFVYHQTISHIEILVYNNIQNFVYKYVVHKERLRSSKVYKDENKSIITYKECLEKYEKQKEDDNRKTIRFN